MHPYIRCPGFEIHLFEELQNPNRKSQASQRRTEEKAANVIESGFAQGTSAYIVFFVNISLLS